MTVRVSLPDLVLCSRDIIIFSICSLSLHLCSARSHALKMCASIAFSTALHPSSVLALMLLNPH